MYHFACLSDRDMNQGMNNLLPWPLTESFIQAAYDPVDLQFQVYWTALDERSSFLRYSLFYGLFFNRCDVRVSYVKQYDDEVTEPYALLPILGLQPEHVAVDNSKRGAESTINKRRSLHCCRERLLLHRVYKIYKEREVDNSLTVP